MKTYALKRLLISIPLVFVMTFVVFIIINWTGSSKFDSYENDPAVDAQTLELEKRRVGIYDPLPQRYLHWLRGVLFDVRFSRERRFIATFEDNDPERGDDRYKFGGTEIRDKVEGVEGEYAVGKTAVPLGVFEKPGESQRLLDRRKIERIVFTAASGSPDGLELVVVSAAGEVTFPFRRAEDGSATLLLPLDELVRKAAIENIQALRLRSPLPGAARISAESTRRRIWQETYPGKEKKRAIQAEFPGREGHAVDLGALKSPYTVKVIDGSDWAPDWNAAAKKADDSAQAEFDKWKENKEQGPKPVPAPLSTINFEALEVDARLLTDEELTVEVHLLCGPLKSPQPVKLGEFRPTRSKETWELSLNRGALGDALHEVRGLRIVSSGKGRVEFDDFRLRASGSPVGVGAPNFGQSWDQKKAVIPLIAGKVWNTIALNLVALVFVWLIALPIGIYSAVRQYSGSEKVISFLTFIGMAMPSFFLAILVMFLISLTYDLPESSWFHGILPLSGRTSADHSTRTWLGQMLDVARHMIAPLCVAILGGIGGLQRVVRGTMLEERRKLYMTTAMAKGLPPWKVLFKHGLRNAIIPFIASLGSLLPSMIGGSAFIEIVFEWPGIGKQMLDSVQSYDIPVVMANTLIVGLLLVIGNLLADILLGIVDPRISLGS